MADKPANAPPSTDRNRQGPPPGSTIISFSEGAKPEVKPTRASVKPPSTIVNITKADKPRPTAKDVKK